MPRGVYATHLPANDPQSIEDMDQDSEISESSEFEPVQDPVQLGPRR